MNPYLGNNAKKVKLLSYMISIFCVLCVASSVQVVKKISALEKSFLVS